MTPANNSSNSNENYMPHMTGGGTVQPFTNAVEGNTTQHKGSHVTPVTTIPHSQGMAQSDLVSTKS